MPQANLALLGSLKLNIADRPFNIAAAPSALLLGYLALHAATGHAIARATLAGKLWPNLSEKRARFTLNDTLYRLRQTLSDPSWLQADSTSIRLIDVTVDVQLFQRSAASTELAEWLLALECYSGDLLEDLDADWLLVPRIALRDRYLQTLAHSCTMLAGIGRIDEALSTARRWALSDPFNEDAHRAVMRLASRIGQSISALQQYDLLVNLLDEEFQTAPLPETRALAAAIRSEYHTAQPVAPAWPTLIGRRHERAMLLHSAELAQRGAGSLILIEGESGIGKTSLADALAEGAAWRGMSVARASAQPHATSPFAPLDAALGATLAFTQPAQLEPGLSSDAIALLHQFVQNKASVGMPSLSEPESVALAFAELLQAVSKQQPLLVILDNMQWAGVQTWLALHACAPLLEAHHLLIVLLYRCTELRADPAGWRALRSLDRALAPPRLELGPLAPSACAELARRAQPALGQDAIASLVRQSGGNPRSLQEALLGKQSLLQALEVGDLPPINATPRAYTNGHEAAVAVPTEYPPEQNTNKPPPLHIRLARADAPLGRTLGAAEFTTVRWTVDAGAADDALLQQAGKVALRRQRIVRLINEARMQGAAPTDLDLARALDVTERTIVADMAALRATGLQLQTRRRAPNGAHISR